MTIPRLFSILSFSIFLSTLFESTAAAADCPEKFDDALRRIAAGYLSGNRENLFLNLRCLRRPVEEYAADYERFGSDDIFDKIERDTYNERLDVIKILTPMMKSKDRLTRGEIAATLAYYNFPSSKQWLSEYPDSPQKAVLYAILKYSRSYRWAIDRLSGMNGSAKGTEDARLAEKMAYLNLLYHLAEPASLPFVESLIDTSSDQRLNRRALEIREKILRMNPDIK